MGFSALTTTLLKNNRNLRRSKRGPLLNPGGVSQVSTPELSDAERANRRLYGGKLSDLHAARKRREAIWFASIVVGCLFVIALLAWLFL